MIYDPDIQVSLGGDERRDDGRVFSVDGNQKCSISLRKARSRYTHPTVLGTHLVSHTRWRIHLA
jgi:hypothetical protein